MYIGRKGATIFSPQTRLYSVWEALTFLLNGVVFALIGLQLPSVLAVIRGNYFWLTLLAYSSIFSLFLIAVRLICVYPAAGLTYQIKRRILKHHEPAPQARAIFMIGWTGMRGVIALAAAISLPQTLGDGSRFATQSLIIFLAFSIILVTLVFQGLTLPPLIRALAMSTPHGDR